MNTSDDVVTEESMLASLGGVVAATNTKIKSPTGTVGLTSSVEGRALTLLGSGTQAEAVASALGVTPSRIAQLLSEKTFAAKVAMLRYENLQKHNLLDSKYDSLEESLLEKLEAKLFLITKPETIIRAIQMVNGAKRKGSSAPTQTTSTQTVVNLLLPKIIHEKFAININNQVISVGEKSLQTIASGDLLKRVEKADEARILEHKEQEAQQSMTEDRVGNLLDAQDTGS